MKDQHPSSEAIDRWLMGERSPATGDHLQACAECRAEVVRMESLVAAFGESARRWTNRQPLAAPPAAWAIRGPRRVAPVRWVAVAAAALLLAAVPAYRTYGQRQAAARASANAILMEEISADISRSAPEPLEPLVRLVSQSSQSTTGDSQ